MDRRSLSKTTNPVGPIALLFLLLFVPAAVLFGQLPAFPGAKTLTEGADPIATGKEASTTFVLTITLDASNYDPGDSVSDVVPAELDVTELAATCGEATVTTRASRANGHGSPSCKLEPDFILWDLDGGDAPCDGGAASLVVTLETDQNPGHCKREVPFYEPTSCGPLLLNEGAILFDPDSNGATSEASNSLQVAACDGEVDAECETGDSDADNDGWSVSCGDCVDEDGGIFPGAGEVCNSLDDDCDGEVDEGLTCDDGGGDGGGAA